MTESRRRRNEFLEGLRNVLAKLEREGTSRIDAERVEELGRRHEIDPEEARDLFVEARGEVWQGNWSKTTRDEAGRRPSSKTSPPPALPPGMFRALPERLRLLGTSSISSQPLAGTKRRVGYQTPDHGLRELSFREPLRASPSRTS